jgi:hypothetical protein
MSVDRGGQIIYSRNHVTWAPASGAAQIGLALTLLFTLDDLSACNNVCRADFREALMLTDMIAFGITLEIAGNRLREPPKKVPFSIFSFGFINHTTDNICTHCVAAWDYAHKLSGAASAWTQGLHNRSVYDELTADRCRPFERDLPDTKLTEDEAQYTPAVAAEYAPLRRSVGAKS